MNWHTITESVEKYIIRIETESGGGTGFLFGYNTTGTLAAIATAAHVIDHAHRWRKPIRLVHHATGQELFLPFTDRVIFLDRERDSASILVNASALPFERETLPYIDAREFRRVGVEVAWLGFPAVAYPELCFFTGCISAFIMRLNSYLVDGVAINGVSGGPVFSPLQDGTPEIIGLVSAYLPNTAGDTPGLLRAQDISALDQALKQLHSFEEAKAKEKAEREKAVAETKDGVAPTEEPV